MELLAAIFLYFTVLIAIGRRFSRKATNTSFYRGERRSPWYMVAFGMIGASISGITFVSIPGMVIASGMTYLQLCLGFILGYIAVAFILLPVYYRLNLTTIYSYLGQRLRRMVLHSLEVGRSISEILRCLYHPATIRISRLWHSLLANSHLTYHTHLALHTPRRHTHTCIHRCFPDNLSVLGTPSNYI